MATKQHDFDPRAMAYALQGLHQAPARASRRRYIAAWTIICLAQVFLAPFRALAFVGRQIGRILPANEVWRRRTISLGTAAISIAAYALVLGWPFAVGLVGLIAVHELGHAHQIRREGGTASAPVFIPFLGALILAPSMGRNVAAEARAALAGPIAGSAAVIVPALAWLGTGDDLFHALTFVGVALNLFNLLPVLPLDGGRVAGILPVWFSYLGVAGGIAGGIYFGSYAISILAVVGVLELSGRRSRAASDEQGAFFQISAIERIRISAVYLILAIGLGLAAWLTYFPVSQLTS